MLLRRISVCALALLSVLLLVSPASASEAGLRIPDLNSQKFFGGSIGGATLLLSGLVVCAAGPAFGLGIKGQLNRLPVHPLMREVSETIYATCKTYLFTQGKFIILLWVFIGAIL